MKKRTSFKNRHLLLFLLVIFTLGLIFGIVIFLKQNNITKSAISLELELFNNIIKTTNQNQILFHIFLCLIIFLLNYTGIGIIASLGLVFYEGISFGFSIAILTFKFKISGLIFALIFNILTKGIYILLIIYIAYAGINFLKKVIKCIQSKRYEISYSFIKNQGKILLIVLGIILVNEILIYFFGNKILSWFLFLLK